MKILFFRVFILCIILFPIWNTVSAQSTTLVKTLEQNFEVKPHVNLDLVNKYGDIIINGWERNFLEVKIKLTSYGKTDSDTKKLMDKVEFDFNVADDHVLIETIIDRNKGLFSDFLNSIGDYSKSLLNKNELDIDFEIWLPASASLYIQNKYGDIVITDVNGKITVDQSHGNFKSNNINNLARISVNYGNIRINSFKTGSISIKGGDLELQRADNVNINSKQSQLFLKNINALTMESTGDRVRVSDINAMKGSSSFSKFDIYRLSGSCQLDQSYGELNLHSVLPGFSTIDLKGKSTDYSIILPAKQSVKLNIIAREDRVSLAESIKDLDKIYVDEKAKTIHITGNYGKIEPTHSILKISSTTGEVSVNFELE